MANAALFLVTRIAYRLLLALWFIVIAFSWGPNLIHFGRLTGLSLDDFVPAAKAHAPAVIAIKQYEADKGHLPASIKELAPDYLSKEFWKGSYEDGDIGRKEYVVMVFPGGFFHTLTYNLQGNDQHWEVNGTVVNGRLPLPSVSFQPSQTATKP